MSRVLHSYYIGQPAKPERRWQDKDSRVHCLCWMLIYRKGRGFAKKNEYSVAIGGGGIGSAKSIKEAKQTVHKYAVATLEYKRAEVEDELKRITKALEDLKRGGVAALEKTEGEYVERYF